MVNELAMLIDTSKCMGCRGCQVACKQWNKRPAEKTRFTGSYQNPPKLSASTWTLIQFTEPADYDKDPRWLFRKMQCFHCTDASCEQVCPTGAIKKLENGIVYINQDLCSGCKNCVVCCPFDVPQFDTTTGTVRKCWMCLDRVTNDLEPACVTACPTGALRFGPREEMLKIGLGRQKILETQKVKSRLYGAKENELGGLHVMTLLTEKADIYALPEHPKKPTAMIIWRWILGTVPGLAIMVAILGYLFSKRSETASDSGGE